MSIGQAKDRRVKGLCDLCGREDLLEVDHDHETDRIRGRVCRSCNFGLGCFKENPELLQRAASYLLNPPLDGSYKALAHRRGRDWRAENLEHARKREREYMRQWKAKRRAQREAEAA